jgi:hypothetical protein
MRIIAWCLLIAGMTVPVQVWCEDAPQGSRVVGQDEDCPSGMVVSGMTGGEDVTTKICVAPNTTEMPDDPTDVGDPNTNS